MWKSMYILRKIRTAVDCRKRMEMWVGKCCTGRENRKNNWGKV